MTTFVLNGYESDSKKAKAKAQVISQIGFGVSVSGDTITVKYQIDVSKVAEILSSVGVQYSGG